MKQKLLNSIRLRVCMLVAVMCAAFAEQVWGAENDTHDFSQTLQQLLNNNASIASINIAAQSYPVKKVIVSYRYNKTIENAVTVGVTVNGVDWGSQYVVGTGSDYSTLEFSGDAVTGEVALSFTNNTGNGTGHGTFYVNNVQLVEGASAAPSYSITAVSSNNEHGTVSLTGSTITATPAAGYRYASPAYTVSPANSATVSQNGNEFSVTPSENTTVTINFERIPTHTATFSVNGNTTSEDFQEGADIDFPDDPDDINGKKFRGWVDSPIVGTTDSEQSFVTSAMMSTSDVTYYAVFATENPGAETNVTKTITTSTTNLPTGYGTANTFTTYTLEGVKFKIQQMYKNGEKLQWRAAGNSSGTGIMYNTDALSKIQSVVLTYNGDSNKNFTLKIGDSENPTSGTSITPSVDEENSNIYTFDCSSYNKSYFVLTNGEYAGYLSSIAITYKTGTPDTYTNYCTTVSDLPLAVVTLSTENITMTWGESGKTLTASATVDDEPLDETITFTPSSANISIDGSGNISCNEPGSYTITATVAATGAHQAGQAVCNVTVNKKDITLAFAEATATAMVADRDYTQTAAATPDAYDGDITYEITSSTSENAIIDEKGKLLFENTGIIVVTATAEETDYYNENTATYTLYVKTTPTLSASDQSIAYGETYTLDTGSFLSGDITLVPTSTNIATADGLTLTSQAVGSTLVTVYAAANDTYVAGSTTFTLTVTAPAGASEKPSADPITVFYESFDKCNGTGGNDGTWSDNAGNGTASYDQSWSTSGSLGGAKQCLKMASGSNSGSITTPDIPTTAGTTYTVTFKAGSWKDKSSTLSLSATGALTTLSISSFNLTNEEFNNYEATFTAQGSKVTLTFSAASKKQIFLDEVRITEPATPITSTTVTTTGGYATYCYQYPLNLDGISGAKAYKVSSLDKANEKVMLTQISGTIKGGVPFILKSDADKASIEIPLADESTNVPEGNLLIGTLAPTFVEQTSGDYTNFAYSKSKECFIMINENGNTVPANRAYLPINLDGSSVKAFSLSFDTETGINEIGSESGNTIFNLAGQRVNKAQKGLYIVNGRKVLVK